MKKTKEDQVKENDSEYGRIFISLLIVFTIFIGVAFITILYQASKKLKPKEPISQVDYSQQTEMKENLDKEGRFDTIIFEFDNDSVKFIY